MNCLKHPAVPAKATCSACAEPYCANCLVTVKGTQYCASCKKAALGGGAVVGMGPSGPHPEAGEALKYAIIGLFCFGFILGPIAVSKGLKARREIEANPRLDGSGKAMAAIIIGIVGTILHVLGLIARFALKE